ncbi:phage major tail tube protein [Geomicrobium sp. JCM 19037]|uniref:phage major tail tube protein n=1 Tax=Geomicrobium sp. JCM 19037 TaxID=1460634 RepID=UPI00045F1C0D|nr:phage major tail tube protein [Geomicrobium sp. JCM 19037]GAK06034.1 phage major tail tube protein [Geomicrobium sp. JCM 19037]
MRNLPTKIASYKAYNNDEELLGTVEVTLPSVESPTETMSGAGIAGEFEAPTPGFTSAMQTEVSFRTVTKQNFSLATNADNTLVLRAAKGSYDEAQGRIKHRKLKITIRYLPTTIELGSLSSGGTMDGSNTLETLYIKIEEEGEVLAEIDKINMIYMINGVDYLAEIRDAL